MNRYYVYFLFSDEQLLYVGSTINMELRLKQHVHHGRKFNGVKYISFDNEKHMIDYENSCIEFFNPILNKRKLKDYDSMPIIPPDDLTIYEGISDIIKLQEFKRHVDNRNIEPKSHYLKIPYSLLKESSLTLLDKLVLSYLLDIQDELCGDNFVISQAEISSKLACSLKSVNRSIGKLKESGYIGFHITFGGMYVYEVKII